jgi:hypothetical protein
VTQRVQQDGQWRDGDTSFFKVNVWRDQAQNLADSRDDEVVLVDADTCGGAVTHANIQEQHRKPAEGAGLPWRGIGRHRPNHSPHCS